MQTKNLYQHLLSFHLIFLLFASSCNLIDDLQEKAEESSETIQQQSDDSIQQGSEQIEETLINAKDEIAQPITRMYYVDPAINENQDGQYLIEASADNIDPLKPKLVLIHGWMLVDRSDFSLSQFGDLKQRNLDKWNRFFSSSQFAELTNAGIEIFAFDYITSDEVDISGKKLRKVMDELFGNEEATVVVYAHSMGALISRFAVYEGDNAPYLKKVLVSGAPFHGSPWAAPEFQKKQDLGSLGEALANFLTNTKGGRDLAWENHDGQIEGAQNTKLTAINAKNSRDNLFFAFYGSYDATANNPGLGALEPSLTSPINVCQKMGENFAPSDCLVPASSATLENRLEGHDMGNYDHFDLRLQNDNVRNVVKEKIVELFGL